MEISYPNIKISSNGVEISATDISYPNIEISSSGFEISTNDINIFLWYSNILHGIQIFMELIYL